MRVCRFHIVIPDAMRHVVLLRRSGIYAQLCMDKIRVCIASLHAAMRTG